MSQVWSISATVSGPVAVDDRSRLNQIRLRLTKIGMLLNRAKDFCSRNGSATHTLIFRYKKFMLLL